MSYEKNAVLMGKEEAESLVTSQDCPNHNPILEDDEAKMDVGVEMLRAIKRLITSWMESPLAEDVMQVVRLKDDGFVGLTPEYLTQLNECCIRVADECCEMQSNENGLLSTHCCSDLKDLRYNVIKWLEGIERKALMHRFMSLNIPSSENFIEGTSLRTINKMRYTWLCTPGAK